LDAKFLLKYVVQEPATQIEEQWKAHMIAFFALPPTPAKQGGTSKGRIVFRCNNNNNTNNNNNRTG
jgi:hypothetical protein